MPLASLQLLSKFTGAAVTEGLVLMVVGMGVVFTALVILWGMLGILGRLNRLEDRVNALAKAKKATRQPERPPAAPAPAPAASPREDKIDAETYAILTAAVMAVVRQPVRIQRVRFVKQDDDAWAVHGRQAIQASHRIRKG